MCTDKARYNISALNNDENSGPACAAHIANLVIKDMFLYDTSYGFVTSVIWFSKHK